jgi:hypothetical protein
VWPGLHCSWHALSGIHEVFVTPYWGFGTQEI